jgi:hypothetical protein
MGLHRLTAWNAASIGDWTETSGYNRAGHCCNKPLLYGGKHLHIGSTYNMMPTGSSYMLPSIQSPYAPPSKCQCTRPKTPHTYISVCCELQQSLHFFTHPISLDAFVVQGITHCKAETRSSSGNIISHRTHVCRAEHARINCAKSCTPLLSARTPHWSGNLCIVP